MGKYIDITGEKYGRLTVIEKAESKNGKTRWLCQCDCGNTKIVYSNDIRTGKTKSCGCLALEIRKQQKKSERKIIIPEDLKGKHFGYLTVLEHSKEETLKHNQGNYWLCSCKCGNNIFASTKMLKGGYVQSCGCLQKEKAKEHMKQIQELGAKARFNDLTGQKFGKLLVLKRASENTNSNKPQWICRCDCGNIKIIRGESLKKGATQSCGCLGNSVGEALIISILEKNNIKYKTEVTFPDLKDKGFLRYDFALLDDNENIIKLIEYDGRQHSDKNSCWYNEDLVRRDNIKSEYAKNHNIPLLRISYLDKDKINLEYLLREPANAITD